MRADRSARRTLTASGLILAAGLTPLAGTTPAAAASRLCGPPADTVPPQISQVSMSTDAVDVTDAPATVTMTVDATDTSATEPASGIKTVFVYGYGNRFYARTKLKLVSGDATDGEWQGDFTVPQTAHTGDFNIEEIRLEDRDHNYQSYGGYRTDRRYSPYDFALHPSWQHGFTITNNGDTKPPERIPAGKLTNFSISPTKVNTTEGSKPVHLSASFSAPRPKQVWVYFQSATRHARFYKRVELKATATDKYVATFRASQWSGDVKAQSFVSARWSRKYRPFGRGYSPETLAKHHFSSQLRIHGASDTTAPELTGLTITPDQVDVSTSKQILTVTANVSDTQSGVRFLALRLSGGGRFGYGFARLKPDGDHWSGQVKIRQCSRGGDWKVSAFTSDRAGNYHSYRPHALAAAGFTSVVTVTSNPGDGRSPEVNNATASGAEHTITLNFSEGVKNVTDTTLEVYPMKPAATRYETTSAISAISCSDGTGTVPCDGSNGLVTSARLSVDDVVGGAKFQVWANQDAVTSQLTDGAGNPLQWGYRVAQVTGS
ncbi:MAG: hypothetical protein JO246_09010 [Frankiaceae bacterium]|nr:hypothetical protein [Frankiaceae bacterium]MBV9872079.1 hypothetical protein [Frankiaceae bacterium]